MVNMDKQQYSTGEVAEILGISRTAVFKKIKDGTLPAQKVGRNYVVALKDLLALMGRDLSESQKEEIKKAVERAIKEYRDVFEKLGKE